MSSLHGRPGRCTCESGRWLAFSIGQFLKTLRSDLRRFRFLVQISKKVCADLLRELPDINFINFKKLRNGHEICVLMRRQSGRTRDLVYDVSENRRKDYERKLMFFYHVRYAAVIYVLCGIPDLWQEHSVTLSCQSMVEIQVACKCMTWTRKKAKKHNGSETSAVIHYLRDRFCLFTVSSERNHWGISLYTSTCTDIHVYTFEDFAYNTIISKQQGKMTEIINM